MSRNRPVPIVNNARRAAVFERQGAGGSYQGELTLEPGQTHHERAINQTYETLVLKNSSGNCTAHSIEIDDLSDDRYERIEVTFDSEHDFRLVRHERRTWTQRISDKWNSRRSQSRDGTLPT